eukprot:7383433-Prymnesium_polylepis.1
MLSAGTGCESFSMAASTSLKKAITSWWLRLLGGGDWVAVDDHDESALSESRTGTPAAIRDADKATASKASSGSRSSNFGHASRQSTHIARRWKTLDSLLCLLESSGVRAAMLDKSVKECLRKDACGLHCALLKSTPRREAHLPLELPERVLPICSR